MSTFAVTVEELTIWEHPNADALELAAVGGYRAVVAKGQYQSGDLAVYIPEQAVLPHSLIAEIGLEGKLAGAAKNRVKAVRLRGELSQGIVFTPAGWSQEQLAGRRGDNLAEEFGIHKWVPEIPAHFSGVWEAAPGIVPYTEIENIKRYPGIFTPGEVVYATEKTHGTLTICTLGRGESIQVASKNLAKQRSALVRDPNNLYWQAVEAWKLEEALAALGEMYESERVSLYGETYGVGVQDLHYGANARRGEPGYVAFDAHIIKDGEGRWLGPEEFAEAMETLGLRSAPVLYKGPYDYETLCEVARGAETLSGNEAHIREGVVVRPETERHSEVVSGRAIAKFISEEYLMRSGGSELE